MATHNEIGKKGEALALDWLKARGFCLLRQNWRYSRYEIDLIMSKDSILHIVEVKTATTTSFGYPEERVTARKFEHLKEATVAFMELHPCWTRVQYDILSVQIDPRDNAEYFFIEDCYR